MSEQAAASGEPVEVLAARSAYTQTFANPDGTFTLRQSSAPQRAQSSDGTWRSVDTTLERRADGSVAPRAAVADVRFSGGGSGDLIRLGDRSGHALSLDWGKDLPAPVLEGSSATYPDVLPDVDLRLTATAEGYQEVLVVKTAQAADNPQLARITLSAQGDGVSVVPGIGAGVRAVDDDGNTVFVGPSAQMWDSAGDTGTKTHLVRTSAMGQAGRDSPTPDGPSDDDHVHPADGPSGGDTVAELPGEGGPRRYLGGPRLRVAPRA
ncbi:hypothetical protein [Wenjunlia tyrosinilytica]|uniref:Uncharacterized protein n=1 Tax=Wenjunlia tyrosinilytica TaxID=1544741 RepID=A0A917ZZ41_9ACTN|nr:hypothetical protein [Wenjunlia tyrosinilytica]GGP01223.1 hypothetical protein GCM10012280_71650 [Wenjunlia tyrosinilytica]